MNRRTKKHQHLDLESLESAAHCLRTLAHPLRLRMIELLFEEDHTVGELAEACGIGHAAASTHLGLMRDRGILRSERMGREVYYRIEEEAVQGIMSCLQKRYLNRSKR